MRNMRFDLKARWALIWSLMAIFFLSSTPWLAEHGIRTQVVRAQATNVPGTPPDIMGFQTSRTVLSHGRVENARQQTPINPNGLRDVPGFGNPTLGTPGLLTAIATNSFPGTPTPASSAWQPDALHITLGWDQRFHKEQLGIGDPLSNPVSLSALTIPSCFTLVVAEGIAPAGSGAAGSIPSTVRWESTGPLIGEGNLYASVSIPAAGILAGDELRTFDQLAAYTANSIIWEAPPFGQIVQDSMLMQFGTKNITAHAVDLSDPANPVIGPLQSAQVEVTRTLHVEIEVLGIEKHDDGSFSLCAIANLFGNSLEPATNFWFRWGYAGKTVSLVGDIPASNLVTIHLPASEENQQAVLYVVASCSGAVLTSDPFTAEPLGVPPEVFVRRPIGLLTFLSGNCTLEDDASVEMKPFGECPEAEMMIDEIDDIGSANSGAENMWVRTTPAQGEVVFGRPEDAAELTVAGNSCAFREVGPDGESFSNEVTWTTPPEKMIDQPWINKPTGFPPFDECTYKGQASVTGNEKGADVTFFAYFHGPVDNVSDDIATDRPYPSSSRLFGNPRFGSVNMGFRFPSPSTFDTLHPTTRYANGPAPFPAPPSSSDNNSPAIVDLYYVIHATRGYWRNDRYQGERIVPEPEVKLHWRYEYSKNKRLATVIRDGKELEAQKAMKVFEGDRVRTESNCKMRLNISNGKGTAIAAFSASPSTEFEIRNLSLGKPNRFDFLVKSGELRSEVFSERGATKLSISSPTATAAVTGTVFKVGYDQREQSSTIAVEKGSVLVTPTNSSLQPFTLNASQQVKVTQNSVGQITGLPTSIISFATGRMLYIWIGAGAVLLTILLLFVVSRAKHRSATQPGDRVASARHVPLPDPTLQGPAPETQGLCYKCGAALKMGKQFCSTCGVPRKPGGITGSTISSVSPPVVAVCPNSQCRQPLAPGKKFCTTCGTRVT